MIKNICNTSLMKRIVSNKTPCYFISPHFDDAIYSAGGLIWYLKTKKVPISVINVFTKPSGLSSTFSIMKYLRSCNYRDAKKLFNDRTIEDKKVLYRIGVKVYNLNFIDALWRIKKIGKLPKLISKIIPEMEAIYPIFSLSMKIGKVSKYDDLLKLKISKKLRNITPKNEDYFIFSPIATGKHMDHTIVSDVSTSEYNNIIYWEDYPYSLNENNKKKDYFIFKPDWKIKERLIKGYKSQFKAIFGKISIKKVSEKYYFKKK